MKKIISSLFILFVVSCAFAQSVVIDECKVTKDYGFQQYTFSVYGDVYVETDPKEPVDLEVKVTNERLAQCWVYVTTDKPQDCGEWRFVKDPNVNTSERRRARRIAFGFSCVDFIFKTPSF